MLWPGGGIDPLQALVDQTKPPPPEEDEVDSEFERGPYAAKTFACCKGWHNTCPGVIRFHGQQYGCSGVFGEAVAQCGAWIIWVMRWMSRHAIHFLSLELNGFDGPSRVENCQCLVAKGHWEVEGRHRLL